MKKISPFIFLTSLALFLLACVTLSPTQSVAVPAAFSRPNVKFNSAGDPNALIKIDEYSDFQCPYCRKFFEETEEKLMNTYVKEGMVYFTYHSVGQFIGPESAAAAEAAYCAGDQNKFWEMHDILFANQNGENVGDFSSRNLTGFAQSIGLDMNAFNACFSGDKYSKLAEQDRKDSQAAGISGTPSFVLSYIVDGQSKTKLIEGAQPFSAFELEIKVALAAMGK